MKRKIEKTIREANINIKFDMTMDDLLQISEKAFSKGLYDALMYSFYYGYALGRRAERSKHGKTKKDRKRILPKDLHV